MEELAAQNADCENFTKTPVPLSKSPVTSPSIRFMTQTVIVSLVETVTHDITYVQPRNSEENSSPETTQNETRQR
ncbi:unnamed protein product [Phaedon cochleariae]|uniref:Uncharacterized protein n=1 Tax=Phaedon cochleariae TaxID=80249 RepID=A0A9N9SBG0_PHACE|nr:unnamed protein product [Phaedon cochleariae]